jgi:hypothetical protein
MTIKLQLVANGVPPRMAGVIGGTVAAVLTAAGLTVGAAKLMSTDVFQVFATVASGAGARFRPPYSTGPYSPGDSVAIANGGAHTMKVYPASGGSFRGGGINAGTATIPMTIASNKMTLLITYDGLNWWYD